MAQRLGSCDPNAFEAGSICFALRPASMSRRVFSVAT